ncbi:hypothetical protein B7R54_01860 [Subtercola boreus]|uniref:DUF4862 domain-containing protein n=1 Tax=Subtercola boreus TaxID=120213 RepID=A0A3E0VGU7_9MICO|nr:DUF4862 family protein [Subtercola boreus]RFA08097.1 hypothetical protein B7R54_01860 [Subtercola boreus]TQL55016.1 uncharacterized protein DUF4862 [Subtercola boreus]
MIVGAYAASPPDLAAAPELEEQWYRRLRRAPGITGLELPFTTTLHPEGMARLAHLLDQAWRNVVTCVPGTGRILLTDPFYGLASDDPAGRRRALDDLRTVHAEVTELSDVLGAGCVQAIQVQSAPNRTVASSSAAAFAASLAELQALDWQGAALMVEHCDAFLPDAAWAAQKGFLTLEEEISAVQDARASVTRLGHTINWARSVIETRDPLEANRHSALLRETGALTALMFSGVSPDKTGYGEAWLDAHLPPAPELPSAGLPEADGAEPASLLTTEAMGAALATAGPLLYAGVKVGAKPGATSVDQRLQPTLLTLGALAALTS